MLQMAARHAECQANATAEDAQRVKSEAYAYAARVRNEETAAVAQAKHAAEAALAKSQEELRVHA